MKRASEAVLRYVDLLRSMNPSPGVLHTLRVIESEHRPEVAEDLRQEALVLQLGHVTCADGGHEAELPCPHCGAAL